MAESNQSPNNNLLTSGNGPSQLSVKTEVEDSEKDIIDVGLGPALIELKAIQSAGFTNQLLEKPIDEELPGVLTLSGEEEVGTNVPTLSMDPDNLIDLDPELGEGESEFAICLFSNDGHIVPRGQLDSLHHVCPAHLKIVQALERVQQCFRQLEEEVGGHAREAAAAPTSDVVTKKLGLNPEHGEGESKFDICRYLSDCDGGGDLLIPQDQLETHCHGCPKHLDLIQSIKSVEQSVREVGQQQLQVKAESSVAAQTDTQNAKDISTLGVCKSEFAFSGPLTPSGEQNVDTYIPTLSMEPENLIDLDPELGEGESEFAICLFSNDGHIVPRGQLDSLHHVCPTHLETIQALERVRQFFRQREEEEAERAREAAACASAGQGPQGYQEGSFGKKKKAKKAKK